MAIVGVCLLPAIAGVGCRGINWGVDFAGDGKGIGASITAAGIRVGVSFAGPGATNRTSRVATNKVSAVPPGGASGGGG